MNEKNKGKIDLENLVQVMENLQKPIAYFLAINVEEQKAPQKNNLMWAIA